MANHGNAEASWQIPLGMPRGIWRSERVNYRVGKMLANMSIFHSGGKYWQILRLEEKTGKY